MADTKVSAMTEVTAISSADELYVNDGGTEKRITGTNLYRIQGGLTIRVYDSGGTDYIELSDSGSTSTIGTNANQININPGGTKLINLPSATTLQIFDGTNSDKVAIQHDGTDLNFTFTGTTDWNISSLSGTVRIGTNAVAHSSGTTGGTGSAGAGNQYVELEIAGTVYKVLHDGTV